MSPLVYALLCVAVPLAWGVVVVFVSTRVERAVSKRAQPQKPVRRTEYHI